MLTGPVQILAVEGKNITTKRGPGTIFEVKASDGRTYSTFDAPKAQKASALTGQVVTISYKERVNGQWTNYDLEDIFGAGEAPVATPAQTTGVVATTPLVVPTVPIPIASSPSLDKDAKITRLAAHKAAASLVGHLYAGSGSVKDVIGDFRKFTEELIKHAETGTWGSDIVETPDAAPEPAQAGSSQNAEIEW